MLSVNKAIFKIAFHLLLSLLFLTAAAAKNRTTDSGNGKVVTGVLNVRSGPGEKHRIIGKLLKGSRVTVLETREKWLKISHGRLEGFVAGKYVELTPASPPNEELPGAGNKNTETAALQGTITTGVLNVRSGPGEKQRIIGKLLKGSRVTVLETRDKWLKISCGSLEGFVAGKYVQLAPQEPPEKGDNPTVPDRTPVPSEDLLTPMQPSGDLTITDDSEPSPFDPSAPAENVEYLKQEALRIEDQISEHETQMSAYSDRETRLIDELDQLGRQLNRTKLQVKNLRKEVTQIEASLKKTESEIDDLEKEITVLDAYSAKRLAALYKLHQLGKMPVLASSESIFDLLSRKNSLERVLSADKAVWNELTHKKSLAETLRNTLAEQEYRHATNIQALDEQLAAVNRQSVDRSKLLEEIRGEKTLMMAAIDSLKQAAFALDRQLDGNKWEIHPAGGHDGENKKPFQTLKGLLQPPVPGKIAEFFGLKRSGGTKSVNFRNGIDIEAEPGEPIRAVCGGNVIYADWFRGYGDLVIIDHGDNYCSVYAHAEEIFKAKGDSVDMDEVIGTVGDTGSLAGTKLYFEIRHEGKPIDPLAWLKRN